MVLKNRSIIGRNIISVIAFLAMFVFLFFLAYKKSDHVRYLGEDFISMNKIEAVALGSSSVINLPLDIFEQCRGLVIRGFGGGTLKHVLSYLDFNFLPKSIKLIIVYIGENDIVYGASVDAVITRFGVLTERLKLEFPHAEVVIVKIKLAPSRSSYHPQMQTLNKALDLMSHGQDVSVVGSVLSERVVKKYYLADGVHLNLEGYGVFLEGVPKSC